MTRARTREEVHEWIAAEERICAECVTEIPIGTRITWGVSGTFAHPACATKARRAEHLGPDAFDKALENAKEKRAEITERKRRRAQRASYHQPDHLGNIEVGCWCERQTVWVPASWVGQRTATCGRKGCEPPRQAAS